MGAFTEPAFTYLGGRRLARIHIERTLTWDLASCRQGARAVTR